MSFSGGACLLSTANDYSRFLQMLLNGGELDGIRVLSPKTIELMTVSHLGDVEFPQGNGNEFGIGGRSSPEYAVPSEVPMAAFDDDLLEGVIITGSAAMHELIKQGAVTLSF
jgi:CubicO group peptidase (beta-lactamase class C family)